MRAPSMRQDLHLERLQVVGRALGIALCLTAHHSFKRIRPGRRRSAAPFSLRSYGRQWRPGLLPPWRGEDGLKLGKRTSSSSLRD